MHFENFANQIDTMEGSDAEYLTLVSVLETYRFLKKVDQVCSVFFSSKKKEKKRKKEKRKKEKRKKEKKKKKESSNR